MVMAHRRETLAGGDRICELLFRDYILRGVPAAASADLLLVACRLAVWLVADV